MDFTVDIDSETYEALETRAKANGFESPEEYGAVVLREVVEELDGSDDDQLEQRLEDLGYLS